jgi:hypothetical protein
MNTGSTANYLHDQKSQPFVVPIVVIDPALQESNWRLKTSIDEKERWMQLGFAFFELI